MMENCTEVVLQGEDLKEELEQLGINKCSPTSDGSKTSYYNIEDWVIDLDDLIESLDLGFDGGNCMKALFGMAIARKTGKTRHDGTNIVRDANKLLHYAQRINDKVNK